MKRTQYIILLFLAIAFSFTSCKKDTEPVLDTTQTVPPTWISQPIDTQYTLTQETAEEILFSLEWTAVEYNLTNLPSPLYTVQVLLQKGEVEGEWMEPIEMFTLAETATAITQAQLNTAIVNEIGSDFPGDTIINVAVRIKASVNSNDVASTIYSYSVISPFQVTPYAAAAGGGNTLWVPGAYQGWTPADAPQIFETDEAGIYVGYVYFPEVDEFDGNFKFTSQPDWDGSNYGAGASEGVLDTEPTAGNLEIPGFGGYIFTVNTNTLTWEFVAAPSWGVIGSGILAGDWTEDVDMFPAEGGPYNVLEVTIDVSEAPAGEDLRFKYRADDGWTLNYGQGTEDTNELAEGGDDIVMPEGAGNYTFKLSFASIIPTYEFIKN